MMAFIELIITQRTAQRKVGQINGESRSLMSI